MYATYIFKGEVAIIYWERIEVTSAITVVLVDHFGEVFGAVSIGMVSFNLSEGRIHFLT